MNYLYMLAEITNSRLLKTHKFQDHQFSQCKLLLISLVLLLLTPGQSMAEDYALVVGVDTYKHGTNNRFPKAGEVQNLRGAGNDARRIAKALRSVGVVLPENRLLINEKATLSRFEEAWAEIVKQSLPGDNIIVTFAGHGGQERERLEPIDEELGDKHDETLMFWDFDPSAPYKGRLLDDELFQMFKLVSDRQVLFVADSCHSAGLTRQINHDRAGLSRGGTMWDLGAESDLSSIVTNSAKEGEDWQALSHVTYLTGTDNEALEVKEVLIDGVAHGALSISFAEGIEGRADTNNDNVVRRDELANYISVRVGAISGQMQTPGFLPRGTETDGVPVISLPEDITLPATTSSDITVLSVPVSVSGMKLPSNIGHALESDMANLHLERQFNVTVAYYGADEITRWSNEVNSENQSKQIQALVDKFRLLETIDASYNNDQVPVQLSVAACVRSKGKGAHCNYRHEVGASVRIDINQLEAASASTANGRYFVLFNLAGAGETQFLYPSVKGDPPRLDQLPLQLRMTVNEPVGRDDLVAVFCRKDPITLKAALKGFDKKNAPTPEIFIRAISGYDCQMNRLAVFTSV